MNENKLEVLFRDAAQSAPAPSFEVDDVRRASARVTARRRYAAAGSSLAAVAVLATGFGLWLGPMAPDQSQVAAPPPAPAPAIPRSGGGPAILNAPQSGADSCGQPDAELAKALVGEVPEAGGVPAAATAEQCPSGSRAAAFALRDGASAGYVSVLLKPASSPDQPGELQQPDGTKQATAKARSGKALTIVSRPDAGSTPPHGDRLLAIASQLAQRF